jgi:hypothetical protein
MFDVDRYHRTQFFNITVNVGLARCSGLHNYLGSNTAHTSSSAWSCDHDAMCIYQDGDEIVFHNGMEGQENRSTGIQFFFLQPEAPFVSDDIPLGRVHDRLLTFEH